MNSAKLFLIPNLISDTEPDKVLPIYNFNIISSIKYFICEDIRTTRRFLKKINKSIDISSVEFFELNKHTSQKDYLTYLNPLKEGYDIGIISESGLPCIADPGNIIVQMAHNIGIKVVPLSGPSSIFMALMASGMNGQNFAFNGYLPIEKSSRISKIKQLEIKSIKEGQTQIFMETPFRNEKLFKELLEILNPNTYLCVAINITSNDEFILTKKISEWKKETIDVDKKNCLFII